MAAYALLIGTKGDSRSLIADGDPREVRRKFKLGDFPAGFDRLEVIETSVGRTRSKWVKKDAPKVAPAEPETEDSTPETEPTKKRGRPRKA